MGLYSPSVCHFFLQLLELKNELRKTNFLLAILVGFDIALCNFVRRSKKCCKRGSNYTSLGQNVAYPYPHPLPCHLLLTLLTTWPHPYLLSLHYSIKPHILYIIPTESFTFQRWLFCWNLSKTRSMDE